MKIPSALAVGLLFLVSLRAQEETPPPIPLAEALKLGAEGIAEKRGDLSEAGMGYASLFYAAAKRLETENALAAKDITLVVELDRYRDAVRSWNLAWSDAMYAVSGGGSMWVHLSSHREATREDMLAKLGQRMPLKSGSASPGTLSKWNAVGAAIEAAPLPEFADDQTKEHWPQQKQALHAAWERLGFELQALAEDEALLLLEHLLPTKEQIGMLKGE